MVEPWRRANDELPLWSRMWLSFFQGLLKPELHSSVISSSRRKDASPWYVSLISPQTLESLIRLRASSGLLDDPYTCLGKLYFFLGLWCALFAFRHDSVGAFMPPNTTQSNTCRRNEKTFIFIRIKGRGRIVPCMRLSSQPLLSPATSPPRFCCWRVDTAIINLGDWMFHAPLYALMAHRIECECMALSTWGWCKNRVCTSDTAVHVGRVSVVLQSTLTDFFFLR